MIDSRSDRPDRPVPFTFSQLISRQDVRRDNFLSRLFAVFSEDVVRIWAGCLDADYEDLGRPTLYVPAGNQRSTLDFTLRHRKSGLLSVAELKCELAFENYRYLCLNDPLQLDHHKTAAFAQFLQCAQSPGSFDARVGGRTIEVDGAILIWGSVSPIGKDRVIDRFGLADVLSIESMIADLQLWQSAQWQQYLETRFQWVEELFRAID